jgi:hypothetical protein
MKTNSPVFSATQAQRPAYPLLDDANLEISRLLGEFEPISLAEMKDLALMNRVDTKFVMRADQLASVLGKLSDSYRVLEINGQRFSHYQTLYFDTDDFTMFRQHHNGMLNRYKVRIRQYVDTATSYFEVKFKNNKRRTIKKRIRTSASGPQLNENAVDFLHEHYPSRTGILKPTLGNTYTRITLASKYDCERLTLDLNLWLCGRHACVDLSGIAIAEVKQDGYSPCSDFFLQMRGLGVRPMGFSKYCAGITLLYEGVKKNRFKPRMLTIEKLLKESKGNVPVN